MHKFDQIIRDLLKKTVKHSTKKRSLDVNIQYIVSVQWYVIFPHLLQEIIQYFAFTFEMKEKNKQHSKRM